MMESTIAKKETTLVWMGMMMLLLVTTVEGLGNLGLPRSNFGVYFQDRGELAASASFWHHHIVVDMPKLADVIPATCMKYIHSNVRPNNYSMEECSAYIEGSTGGLHGMLINMNLQVIRKFDQLASAATEKLAKIPRKGARSRRTRSAPLSFIGDLSKSLFGTARQDDLELVAKKVNKLIARGLDMGATLAAHEENFQSYMAVNNKRFDSLKEVVATNHMAIENIANQTLSRIIDFESTNTLLIQRQNETNFILSHLNDLEKSIMSMPGGVFPQLLVSDEQIRSAGNHIRRVISKSYKYSAVLHAEPEYFYNHADSFLAHIDTDGDIWITLKFPVGADMEETKLYQIDTYPVPASKVNRHATRIEELPEYVAIRTGEYEEVEYAPMTTKQVQACSYTGSSGTDFFCPFGLSFFDISEETCLAALIKDDSTLIHKYCDFLFFRDHIKPGFIALSRSNFLLYDVDKLLLTCGKNPTKSVIGCHFCVINVPCNCQVLFRKQRYIASVDEECSGVRGSVTRKHLVNLAMIKAFELNLHKTLAASESVEHPTMSAMPELDFFHHEFKDFVARDNKTGLSLKRIAQASKEHQKVFESLSDPLLMGKLNLPNTFEPVHIMFIVTAVLIIGGVVVLVLRDRRNNSTIVRLNREIETLNSDVRTLRNNVNRNEVNIADMLGKMVIPSAALAPGAEASNMHDIVLKTSSTTLPTTIKDATESVLDDQFKAIMESYLIVALVLLVAVLVILVAAFVYYRCWCSRKNSSTLKIVLNISGISNQVLIGVRDFCGNFKDIALRNREKSIKLKVKGLYLNIEWGQVQMVDIRTLEPIKLATKVLISPLDAYRINKILKNQVEPTFDFYLFALVGGRYFHIMNIKENEMYLCSNCSMLSKLEQLNCIEGVASASTEPARVSTGSEQPVKELEDTSYTAPQPSAPLLPAEPSVPRPSSLEKKMYSGFLPSTRGKKGKYRMYPDLNKANVSQYSESSTAEVDIRAMQARYKPLDRKEIRSVNYLDKSFITPGQGSKRHTFDISDFSDRSAASINLKMPE